MNVSFSWLREYCDLKVSADDLARMLPDLGLQVESVSRADGDTVLGLEITANRPDLLSMIGVAREGAAATGGALKIPKVSLKCGGGTVARRTGVTVDAPDLCLRYTARLITGVRIG